MPDRAFGQGTAFTYQGRLAVDGAPASGAYDLQFTVFSAAEGSPALAGPLNRPETSVSNGLFSALLDFGPGVFTGGMRWLEIGIRTNGGSAFTVLAPRQALTAAPYAILAGNVPDGAITTAKLGAGAVTTANLATNSITTERISPGSITSVHLAPGAIGAGQLTKPYQSGTVALENFGVSANFASYSVSQTINFSSAFASPPVVTLGLETSLSSAADRLRPLLLKQKRTNGFDITFPVLNLPVPVVSRGNIDIAPMVMVHGRPGMVYRGNNGALMFARSLDATGRRWPVGISVGQTPKAGMGLTMVNGYPAVAFIDNSNNLRFVRATETNGVTWSTAVTVQTAAPGVFQASQLSLAIIGGRPAIACYDNAGGEIFYYRANDVLGDTWPAAGVLAATGKTGVSLAEIGGRPAISFAWDNGLPSSSTSYQCALRYVRANDAAGGGWPATPATLMTAGPLSGFLETYLLTVSANPAVMFKYFEGGNFPSYHNRFARATDAAGVTWGASVKVFAPADNVGSHYAALVGGNPAVVWHDPEADTLRYSFSANNGASFATTIVYEGVPTSIPALLDVAGRPAISFSSPDVTELWYIRDTNLIPDTSINWIAVAP